MYDYAKCDEQLRSCLTTPFKFELHFTHISRTVGSLKVRTQGWKRVVEGGKGVTVHKLTHVSNTLSLFPLETFRFLQCAHNNEEDAQQRRREKVTCFIFTPLIILTFFFISSRNMQVSSIFNVHTTQKMYTTEERRRYLVSYSPLSSILTFSPLFPLETCKIVHAVYTSPDMIHLWCTRYACLSLLMY